MQDEVGQLASIAALATAAHMRYLQSHPSPAAGQPKDTAHALLHPARATSTWPAARGLILRVSQFFKKCHSSVVPVVSQADQPRRPPQTPQACQLWSDSSPSPPSPSSPDEMLRISSPPLPSTPQAASLYGCYMPSTVRACVRQQAACILGSLNLSSLASLLHTAPGMPGLRDGGTHGEAKEITHHSDAVLASLHSCERVGASNCTMLACEGIAINSLFDHGTQTHRV
jgi:hypothetical protein